jgi:xanthine dehydrogenase accessory factor
MRVETLRAILDAREGKRALIVFTDLASGAQSTWEPAAGEACPEPALEDTAREALRADRSRSHDDAGRRVFVQVFNPRLRLFVIGAVHIAQALAPIASLLGYDVTVVDPRRSFATVERFPGIALSDDWPDDALEAARLDARTAVVTLTHDPKLDDPALEVALASDGFYIGALGSRRTHATRLERLAAKGFDEASLARIHAPVGLDIGARSPAEIAAAVIGEITAVLRKGDS